MSETFAQASARVAREEAEGAESNSDSEVLARTVTPVQAVFRAFTHCFDWKGRASRAEFWWYWLFFIVVSTGLAGGMFYLSGILLNNESSLVVSTVLVDGYFDGLTLGEYPYICRRSAIMGHF